MNLYNEYNTEQIDLLNRAGIVIEDKNYEDKDIKYIEASLAEYIFNQSKNNVWKVRMEFDEIIEKLNH